MECPIEGDSSSDYEICTHAIYEHTACNFPPANAFFTLYTVFPATDRNF